MASTQNPHTRLIIILAMLTAFGPLATDMYLPAFGQLSQYFSTSSSRIESTLSAFFLGLALGQALYGPFIDRFGRRIPLLFGIVLFCLATLGAILTRDIDTFIGMRLLQALGGCAGMVIARAIINDLFSQQESARALSLMMIMMMVAPIAAPVLGSVILVVAGWHAIFGLVLVFALCVGWLVWRYVPETLAPEKKQPLNLRSVLGVYAKLCGQRAFILPAVVGGIALACMFSFITGSPFVFMSLFGVSEHQYGWLFGLNACGIGIGAQLNRMCLRRWSPRQVLTGGLYANVAAGLTLAAVADTTSLAVFLVPLWFALASLGFIGANAAAVAMRASGKHPGSGSALIGTMQFGFAFLVSSLVAASQNGTAYPMAIGIALCGLLSNILWFVGRKLGSGDK